MPRAKGTTFVCQECGYVSPGWLGRCPACGRWNTITEEVPAPLSPTSSQRLSGDAVAAPTPRALADISVDGGARLSTGLPEFDRVLGGGLVPGSVVLVGGEPGVGKSTLLLQALLHVWGRGVPAVLVSGEESAEQVRLRSLRLPGGAESRLPVVTETRAEAVAALLVKNRPAVCVVDSIQTMWTSEAGSSPGSVTQVRESAGQLLRVAKEQGIALLLVGHVTKEGELAGPRVLEHMVDGVLSFEGERTQPFRILRAVKNRFGSTNEVGVFQMGEQGLAEVADPSSVFLEDGDLRSGSVVVPVMEGSRCLLAEIQALVAPSAAGIPQRVARGVDRNRLAMLVAVLGRRARVPLLKCDIFVNVAGGLVIEDPAADLGVLLAMASAWRGGPAGQGVAAFGEVSLTGKVRYVSQGEKRVQELMRRGFVRIVLPGRNAEEWGRTKATKSNARARGVPACAEVSLLAVTDVEEAVRLVTRRSNDG